MQFLFWINFILLLGSFETNNGERVEVDKILSDL